MLKNKCRLYVIISIRFFSITICNLLNRPRVYCNYEAKAPQCCVYTHIASLANYSLRIFPEHLYCTVKIALGDLNSELFIIETMLLPVFIVVSSCLSVHVTGSVNVKVACGFSLKAELSSGKLSAKASRRCLSAAISSALR